MRADLLTPAVPVVAGTPAVVELEVLNTGDVIDQISCVVPSLDAAHVQQLPPGLTLFPGERASVTLLLHLPAGKPAGLHEIDVEVHGRASGTMATQRVLADIAPRVAPELTVTPELATGGKKTTFTLTTRNAGNTDLQLVLRATDRDQRLALTLDPPILHVAPGQTATATLRASGKRPLLGAPKFRALTVSAEQLPLVLSEDVRFKQKPRFPTGLLTALTLMCIVALWAVAVVFGVKAAMAPTPVKKALPSTFATGIDPATLDPAVVGADIAGTVSAATTGKPLPRITVELLDGKGKVVGAAATKEDGTYSLPKVLPGVYALRFRAGGFTTVWFPGVPDQAAAGKVTVVAGAPAEGFDAQLTGGPGEVTGEVLAGDGQAVPVSVEVIAVDQVIAPPAPAADAPDATAAEATADTTAAEATADATADSLPGAASDVPAETAAAGTSTGTVVATLKIPAGGTFRAPALTTPGTYRIRVTAPGFQPQEITEALEGGATLELNPIRLVAAAGTITGRVVDRLGTPIGEVAIVTKAGGQEVKALTPTEGDVGTFTLNGLPTPATYLLSFTKPGFGTEVVAVPLTAGEARGNLQIVLAGASGSVTGTVTGPDGNGIGGVQVALVGGTAEVATTTFTSGDVGGYRLSGLPLPGTYTITFRAPGYAAQTVRVEGTKEQPDAVANVSLPRTLGRITGVVQGPGGQGVGSATVEVSDGATVRTSTTATAPAGALGTFEVNDVPPGSYTVTIKAAGYGTQTALLTVDAGGTARRTFMLVVTA